MYVRVGSFLPSGVIVWLLFEVPAARVLVVVVLHCWSWFEISNGDRQGAQSKAKQNCRWKRCRSHQRMASSHGRCCHRQGVHVGASLMPCMFGWLGCRLFSFLPSLPRMAHAQVDSSDAVSRVLAGEKYVLSTTLLQRKAQTHTHTHSHKCIHILSHMHRASFHTRKNSPSLTFALTLTLSPLRAHTLTSPFFCTCTSRCAARPSASDKSKRSSKSDKGKDRSKDREKKKTYSDATKGSSDEKGEKGEKGERGASAAAKDERKRSARAQSARRSAKGERDGSARAGDRSKRSSKHDASAGAKGSEESLGDAQA